ncbi:hypothetical protein CW745_05110 [Psychromonas sp. psych-6C06]|uniref:hypothetical protein n=1 Tax=Psychromonas sp. psych-6C06 TaxID=2058089 RepID=UPI000C31C1F7|nr:hypothetical protein [Psychromonas sp. psych-6C06]PKF62802.1 hypothetical protein CW745_05110 [Psychromonas sp. psych-6C06]
MHYDMYPLKISELNELLTQSDLYKSENGQDLNASKHVEADYIADILLKLKLKTPRLSRDVVKKLHSGEMSWTNINGEDVSLAESFDFSLLEELGILFFEHGWVHISAHLPNESRYEVIDESVKPIIRFAKNLQDIDSRHLILNPTQFSIDKLLFEKIVPSSYEFKFFNIEITKESELYTVIISEDGWHNGHLINYYFWKKFVHYENKKEIREKYYDLRQSYIDVLGMPNEDIFNHEEKQIFINFCKENIECSTLLTIPFERYKNILWSHRGFDHSIISVSRTMHINIDLGNEEDKRRADEVVEKTIHIDEVVKSYSVNRCISFETDIDLINWADRNHEMHDHQNLVCSSLRSIIDHDIFIHYSEASSHGVVDELYEKAKDNVVLRFFLLNETFVKNTNTYYLYLLSRPDAFLAGFYKLIGQIKRKYTSNRVHNDYVKTIENILELLCITTINMGIKHNRERELSKLILFLAKDSINSYERDDSINLSCLNILISCINKDNAVKVYPHLLNEIKTIELDPIREKYTLYVLFKMLDCSQRKFNISEISIVDKIKGEILLHYKKLFEFSLLKKSSCLKAEKFYDELYWSGVGEGEFTDKFTSLMPTTMKMALGFSSTNKDNPIQYTETIKNYIQVLINIFSLPNANKNKIGRLIRDTILDFGFENQDISFPLLNDSYTRLNEESYDLWDKLTNIFNDFNDDLFDELLNGLSSKAPLSAMLTLLSNTHISSRRKRVLSEIDSNDYSEKNESSLDFIEKSFSLALESSKLDLAKLALNKSKQFFENHRYKNHVSVQELIFKWTTLEYKYELLVQYYSDDQPLEKEKSINELSIPKLDVKFKNNSSFKHWVREANIFRNYVIGLIHLHDNPKLSSVIFQRLFNENKSSLFSHLIFTSKIQGLISDDATVCEFENTINEYINQSDHFSFDSLPLNYKSDYLYALFLAKKYDHLVRLCSKLNTLEINYKPVTITYCKVLRLTNNILVAQELIDNYKKYHAIEDNDSDLIEEVELIATSIKEKLQPLQREMMKHEVINAHKSNDDLRVIFREIKAKSVTDLACILSNDEKNSVEVFLYREILACVEELLIRAKNLEILNKHKNEDLINDWCVSLANHRLSWFGLTLCDQKRTGKAPSGIGVGESDGLILDNRNTPISIFEALNLSSLDNTTIDAHLNKISDYDLSGLSPVFIVSYCYFSNFTEKVQEYFLNLKSKQYDGFKDVDKDNHEVISLKKEPALITAVEYRFREDKKIAIYHLLVDLKIK